MLISDLIVSISNMIHEHLLECLSQNFFAVVFFHVFIYLAANLILPKPRSSQSKALHSEYFISTGNKLQQWSITNGLIEVCVG